MCRRLAYMALAIIASMVLFTRPVFNFQDDKGIKYIRSFSIEDNCFYVTQTEMETGISQITAVTDLDNFNAEDVVTRLTHGIFIELDGAAIPARTWIPSAWRESVSRQ